MCQQTALRAGVGETPLHMGAVQWSGLGTKDAGWTPLVGPLNCRDSQSTLSVLSYWHTWGTAFTVIGESLEFLFSTFYAALRLSLVVSFDVPIKLIGWLRLRLRTR